MPPEAMQRLRQQFPQYADIPDADLARKVIDKYPQYKDALGDIAGGDTATERGAGISRPQETLRAPEHPWVRTNRIAREGGSFPEGPSPASGMRDVGTLATLLLPWGGIGQAAKVAASKIVPEAVAAFAPAATRVGAQAGFEGAESGMEGKPVIGGVMRGILAGLGGEGVSAVAERTVIPKVGQMIEHGTLNPREAGRRARDLLAQERRDAIAVAQEQTRLAREASSDAYRAAREGRVDAYRQARETRTAEVQRRRQEAASQTAEGRQRAEQTATSANQMVRGTKASQVAHDMGKVIPELAVEGPELYGMAKDWGKGRLDQVFASSKAEIASRISPEARLRINGENHTLDSAVAELRRIGDYLTKGAPVDASAKQAFSAADYGRFRQQIVEQLNLLDYGARNATPNVARYMPEKMPAGAGDIFDAAMKSYSAGRGYIGVIAKSLDRNRGLDPSKLVVNVNRDFPKLRRQFGPAWDEAETALLRGETRASSYDPIKPQYPSPVEPTLPPKVPFPARVPKPDYIPPTVPTEPTPRAPFRFSPEQKAIVDRLAQHPMAQGAAIVAFEALHLRAAGRWMMAP